MRKKSQRAIISFFLKMQKKNSASEATSNLPNALLEVFYEKNI